MSDFVDEFLMKSVLGRGINPKDAESVIKGCIRKAYDDMLTAGRFYKIGDKKSNCDKIHILLKNSGYRYSRELIRDVKCIFGQDKIFNSKSFVTTFGLAQKVVNMTFKYFYCFRDPTGLDIDFTQCDCPIDNVVLDDMNKKHLLKEERSAYTWSKLDERQYTDLQDALNDQSSDAPERLPPCSPRLCYDFSVW